MRTEQEIEAVLDSLIMKAASEESFQTMTPAQRMIAAVQLLVSSSTRSGLASFFEVEPAYLRPCAHEGLKALGVERCSELYGLALKQVEANETSGPVFDELADQIVIRDFDKIYESIRRYVSDHYDELSYSG